jgi:uncharacterized protein YhaN
MRLTALSLRNYGNFADTNLEFDPAPGRINLVLAPNGAGKSVLRAAFGDLLFGIGAQTPMGFRHGYPGMQILARGIGAGGEPVEFSRRKGRTNTLLGADEQPLNPAALTRLLGSADRGLLERLFALDTARLREGGQGLLASGGALAEALLQAAGGFRSAKALKKDLEDERDKLAPRHKRGKTPFYAARDRLNASRQTLKDQLVKPDAWRQREAALAEAIRQRDQAQQEMGDTTRAIRRLERARSTRPLLARHDGAMAWLDAHPQAPYLPPDLSAKLAQARHAVQQQADLLRNAQRICADLREQARAIAVDQAVLRQADAIAALQEAAGAAEKARRDLPAIEAECRALEARIGEGLLGLGLPGDAAGAATLLPSIPLIGKARRLAEAQMRHAGALADLPGRIATLEDSLARAKQALELLPTAQDQQGLAALVTAITAEGDPSRLAAAAAARVEQARSRLAIDMARLPAILRDPTALQALSPPDIAALRALAETRAAADAEARRLEAEWSRLDTALRQNRQQRAGMDSQGALPDPAALEKARARREAGWHLIYQRAFTTQPPDDIAERAYAPEPLPLAYARAVTEADAVADQRLAEAARLATAAELDRAAGQLATALQAALAAAEASQQRATRTRDDWAAAMQPLGMVADAELAEIQAFLSRRDAALEAILGVATAEAGAQALAARHLAEARRLCDAMGLAVEAAPDLRRLLDLAETRQREATRDAAQRATLVAEHDNAESNLAEALRQRADVAARSAGTAAEWREVLLQLHRDPTEQPEDGLAALALFDALRELLSRFQDREDRLRAMRVEIDSFTTNANALGYALDIASPAGDAFATARLLAQRLKQDQANDANAQMLRQQVAAAEAQVTRVEQSVAEAAAMLSGTVAEAGATTPEDAEIRIGLSMERHRQANEQDAALRALLEQGDGLPLEALRQEAQGFAPEELEPALAVARGEQELRQTRIAETAAIAAGLQGERDTLGQDDGIAAAAQEHQVALAQIGRTLEDALLMQVAASLLEAALAAVQETGDDTLLRRISAVFSALTEGRYNAVQSREDDKGIAHLLIRQRDFPSEETTVEALSEGTRDQLFLALRLVAIEDHATGGSPLPFLGDDILQSFDDRRAAAAFRVLLRLSETTQVILLSHHRHLLDVASAALPAGTLHVQFIEAGFADSKAEERIPLAPSFI